MPHTPGASPTLLLLLFSPDIVCAAAAAAAATEKEVVKAALRNRDCKRIISALRCTGAYL